MHWKYKMTLYLKQKSVKIQEVQLEFLNSKETRIWPISNQFLSSPLARISYFYELSQCFHHSVFSYSDMFLFHIKFSLNNLPSFNLFFLKIYLPILKIWHNLFWSVNCNIDINNIFHFNKFINNSLTNNAQ